MSATFEGFMVEARNSTEDFDSGSTIWGTWVTDLNLLGSGYDPGMNLLYHTIECNRSLTSSDGSFDERFYCTLSWKTKHKIWNKNNMINIKYMYFA